MGDLRTGSGSGKRCSAGVCKQIQHLDLTAFSHTLTDEFSEPVPVSCLLREKTGVLEGKGFQIEGEVTVGNGPLFRQVKELPLAAALIGTMVMCIQLPPLRGFFYILPDDLRIRAAEDIFSPAFQFFTVRGVDDLIIFPVVSKVHKIKILLNIIVVLRKPSPQQVNVLLRRTKTVNALCFVNRPLSEMRFTV